MPIVYVLILLSTSFLWGGNFVYSKFLVSHASPVTLTTLRWVIAVIVLLPLLIKKERKLLPPKDSILPLFLMGVTGVVFFNIFQFLALAQTSSINAGLISTLNPLSIAASSAFFLRERLRVRQLLAMLLSFIGVVIVISKGSFSRVLALDVNSGDLWMIAAVILWGIYSVCGKWAMKKVSPLAATFYSGVFGTVMLLPFNHNGFNVTAIDTPFILSLLYTAVVSTVVCMLLWNLGIQKVGPTKSGIFLNFNPIFTAILAFFILHEMLNWAEIAGGMIVIIGCWLFSRADKTIKNTPKH
jgi:drug/metabolite transporter (DMT)-like permease